VKKILLMAIGFLNCLAAWMAVQTGHVSFGRRYGHIVIYASQNPSGFWFGVTIYVSIAIFFFYFAYKIKSQ
jgi:hypothetical protein